MSGKCVNQDLAKFGYACAMDSEKTKSNRLDDEGVNLDLSRLTFEELAAFFFARKVVPDDEQYDYFLTDQRGEKYSESNPSSPEILVNHLTKLFSNFGQIAN